ncbi:MAG: hypothetical protein QOJ64_1539 [Acidobacteriota bacterium]|jgi:hypothetical protein|nr:hypothetical protein [Acidobacteriota bacterium]
MKESDGDELWYQPDLDVFLNRWFAHYEDARDSRENEGGYLFPFKRHFFVCEADVIRAIGLDSADPDWQKVGWDCASPVDEAAYQRLRSKREAVLRGKE